MSEKITILEAKLHLATCYPSDYHMAYEGNAYDEDIADLIRQSYDPEHNDKLLKDQ